jgi:Zn-dependent protease with chaperone function
VCWILLVAYFAAGAGLNTFAHWAGLYRWRKAQHAHWTERARLLWPVRVTAVTNVMVLPVFIHQVHHWFWTVNSGWWFAYMLAACLGALLGTFPLDSHLFPNLKFRTWTSLTLGWWGIHLGGWISLIAGMILMPTTWGWGTVWMSLAYVAFNLLVLSGAATRVLLLAGCLTETEPNLRSIIHEAAARRGIKLRRTWTMCGESALAYAFPISQEVVVSQRLLDVCEESEVLAICAHELAHLSESRMVLAGRILGSFAFLPLIFLTPMIHSFSLWGVLALGLLMFLLTRFSRRLSIEFEKRADAQATTDQISDGVYARALEKIYEANQLPAVNSKNTRTHPHLYDRLIAAGLTPSYPRPPAPRSMSWPGKLYALAMGVFLSLSIARDFSNAAPSNVENTSRPPAAAQALPNLTPQPTHEPSHFP